MATLLWLQTSGCSGDTMSLLGAEEPDVLELLELYSIELLYHPSLSMTTSRQLSAMLGEIAAGERELTFLCVEGAIATGPDGTGLYDTFGGEPKKDLVRRLADRAQVVVAVGTCASFGGLSAADPNPIDAVGLQWRKAEPGGLLPPEWRSRAGLPVVNLAGCPAHTAAIVETVAAVALGDVPELDELHRPTRFYGEVVHQGCTRNEHHEYDIEEMAFGGRGCLFFNLGCQGPRTQGVCNTILWGGVGSKPRAGVPCFGCTSPTFPQDDDLFRTDKIGDVPVSLPLGVERARYMAYKGLARAAAPDRLLRIRRKS